MPERQPNRKLLYIGLPVYIAGISALGWWAVTHPVKNPEQPQAALSQTTRIAALIAQLNPAATAARAPQDGNVSFGRSFNMPNGNLVKLDVSFPAAKKNNSIRDYQAADADAISIGVFRTSKSPSDANIEADFEFVKTTDPTSWSLTYSQRLYPSKPLVVGESSQQVVVLTDHDQDASTAIFSATKAGNVYKQIVDQSSAVIADAAQGHNIYISPQAVSP